MERLPHGTRRLAAQLRTKLKTDEIWSVLTDYENLNKFIPNLSSSQLIYKEANKVRLKQVGCQEFIGFKFSAEVQIELIESLEHGKIDFHQIKGDFRRFEGAWTVHSDSDQNGSYLLYELTVQGCIGMPVALIEHRLREDLTTNLLAVEDEALNRREIFLAA